MRFVQAIRSQESKTVPRLIFLAGPGIGIVFFIYYYVNQLTVAHYDAKAHLLVSRRIVDSIEPGYAQMGVQWLPLISRIRQWYGWELLALCIQGMQLPPLARDYRPMMKETLEHEFIEPENRELLQYLRQHYDGRKILIDMGKQAPLVYDSGLAVKDFIYNEGGEVLWHKATVNAEKYVGWICAGEGDAVWKYLQMASHLFDAYVLAVKTDFFSLYRLKY